MVKNGSMHLESLQDGRRILLDGAVVEDPVHSKAYQKAIASAARLYDLQADPRYMEKATFLSPSTGEPVNRCWQLPTTYEELLAKRDAMVLWAEATCGMMGRSPDHVASCLAGMVMGIETFDNYPGGRADALLDYFHYARDRDLFLSYVIVNPQTQRIKPTQEQGSRPIAAHICDEDSQGITIHGAKMLGTSSILSNEILVGNIQPLKPEEEHLAFTVALPLNTAGISILSRRSYEAAAPSVFDYPLSSRFDENDAIIYFDQVKVPWERVFVIRDVALSRAQFHETPAQLMMGYQCIIRLMVKMRFLLALARRISELNDILTLSPIQEKLGYLASQTTMVEGLVKGMEASGSIVRNYYLPDIRMLHAAQVLTQEMYPQFILAIRELAGGGLLMLPSSQQDFQSQETAPFIEWTQHTAQASGMERVKTMKLAWDALGSEFGSRHLQYEMFYAGASFLTRGNAFRSFDWQNITQMLNQFLVTYDVTSTDASLQASYAQS